MILLLACTQKPLDSAPDSPAPVDSEAPVPACDELVCEEGLCWQGFCEGSFTMGSPEGEGQAYEWPAHHVDMPAFSMLRNEVTVEAYQVCIAQGACEPWPDTEDQPSGCNQWTPEEVLDHPQNCVDWDMATAFCTWAGARLPTEAEWEYAARSAGQEHSYPWGEAEPDCELANYKSDTPECGSTTEPVCSHPAGNTEQGLCDMGGNVYEWVEDWFHNSYEGAPDDGSAWNDPVSTFKTMRGSGIGSGEDLRTRNRTFHEPYFSYSGMGFRCAR